MLITKNSFCFIILVVAAFFINSDLAIGQRIVDKNKGDHNQTKKGFMDGNLAATVYYNFGEIADWLNEPSRSGVWPKGTNHTYVDGVAIIVQAEATDPAGKLIHPLETNYYEFTRFNAATGVTYGWWPLPGYSAPYSSSPARSDDPVTWPVTWPDRPTDWEGTWNGFFGKGVFNADVETYFVFDDNEDREYLLKNNFTPDVNDPTRGGLGMQVRARGFQWSQVLAEDVIFWYYEITNMGTYDYEKTLFAQYVDWGIGGHDNSSNNAGDYNELLDMSYAYSTVPYGSPGNWSPVGLAGYAFLESPGVPDDSRDNDSDGLTDEKRNNTAAIFITDPNQDPFLRNVFQDTTKFRQFYGYSWRPHWDADENANWKSYFDLNNNNQWDAGEPLYDDVGTDGIGPFDANYSGPDNDGTEANGKPDQGEPNFGILDKDESDQLGLTGFAIYAVHKYELNRDEENWTVLSGLPEPHGQSLIGVNLANYFSSYLFSMNGRNTYSAATGEIQEEGETERFSMSMIFGINQNDLFRRKKTVQQIYNANYRFAKPPEKPILTAVPDDHKVILYWDDRAEKTFDGIPPSETTTILKKDINGNITTDINTAVITPRAPAAGYQAPEVTSFEGSGPGTGNISIEILNPDSIKHFNTYRLEFDENTPYRNLAHPEYSLLNVITGDTLINHQRIDGVEEQTPVLNGFTVDIKSDTAVAIDFDKTGWVTGNSNYIVQVGFDSRYLAAYLGKKINYPADFEIKLMEPGQGDLSFPATAFSQPIQSNIIVNNLTEGIDHFQFIFRDANSDKIFNDGDAIFFVFGDSLGKKATNFSNLHVSWSVTLLKDTTIAENLQRAPQYGEVFKVVNKKPFRKGEFYEFALKGQGFDKSKAESDLNNVAVVPNPYVGAASWEPLSNEVGRGERRIYFMHLPSQCTISIYTISGKLVDTIEHSSSISDGQESWDLVSRDGMDIAFGVYVYHVDAPGIGEKIGKFAIIK